MRFILGWAGLKPCYQSFEHKHETIFAHRQFHWLWFNLLWDYRDMRA